MTRSGGELEKGVYFYEIWPKTAIFICLFFVLYFFNYFFIKAKVLSHNLVQQLLKSDEKLGLGIFFSKISGLAKNHHNSDQKCFFCKLEKCTKKIPRANFSSDFHNFWTQLFQKSSVISLMPYFIPKK